MQYRFPHWKGETFSSHHRHQERYEIIKPFLGKDSVGAEIGVWKGGFGEFLQLHCKTLYLVDHWGNQDARSEAVHQVYEGDAIVKVRRQRSIDFFQSFDNNHFDFLYVDACHEFEDVLQDVVLGFRKLKPGRFMVGDDWNLTGVRYAVSHFGLMNGIRFMPLPSSQWAMYKSNEVRRGNDYIIDVRAPRGTVEQDE